MIWLWTILWAALAGPGTGASPSASIDSAALEHELDTIVSEHIAGTGVPGVVVTVTSGSRVIVERGWGVADLESGRPMDPNTTLVRIASLSKTFTATAVAQLEDAGRLELDTDIDAYLQRVKTAGPFTDPVTLRHLLAHTSGFINFNSGRVSRRPLHLEDFESFMALTMPPRVYPPGVATLYTNHGNALAGLVVQDVTGVPFAQYVADNIFAPLKMDNTVYYLDEHQPELARSYDVAANGVISAWPYEHFATVPASGVHTTAHDMAQFLMLHAGNGRVHRKMVLSDAAIARMRTPHPTIEPGLNQYHYAFSPTQVLGHKGRGHGGSVPAFLSRMIIFDDAHVGVFVAQNAFGPNVARRVIEAVATALPGVDPPPAPIPAEDGRPVSGTRLVGEYRVLGKGETAAFTRPRAVLSQDDLRVGIDSEGFLVLDGRQYVRTDVLRYESQDEDGGIDTIVFVLGDNGRATWLHNNRTSAFRAPWYGGRQVQLGAYALALLLVMGGWIALPRHRDAARGVWTALAVAVLLGTLGPQVFAIISDAGQPLYTHPLRLGIPGWIVIVLWVPRIATVLALACVLWPQLRHRGGLSIAAGALLLSLLEQYWQTPAPGLPPA